MTVGDRPVSLDLGTFQQSGYGASPQSGFESRREGGGSTRPDTGQQEQLQKDAVLLRERLQSHRGEVQHPASRMPLQPLPPPLPQPEDLLHADSGQAQPPASRIPPSPQEPLKTESDEAAEPVDHNMPTVVQDMPKAEPYEAAPSPLLREPRKEPPDEPEVVVFQPFDLFKAPIPTPADAAPVTPPTEINDLEINLTQMARRLMIGESPRASEIVRMELAAGKFPGVTLEVFRDQGAIVAQFICANEDSRTRLSRAVSWLSESLSQRLSHDTLVRVLTDDPEDPSTVEVRHQGDRD